ncbi:hypothetical protein ACKVV1_009522 [Pyricularia oryzae]
MADRNSESKASAPLGAVVFAIILSATFARFAATVLYTVGLFTVKMTFLLQYLRILGDDWRAYRKFLASTLLIGLWAMSEFWVNVFVCIPVEGIWDSRIASSCIPNGPYQYVYISLDIVSAIAIFLFPIMFLRHIVIGWPEAVILAVVFTFGLFVVVLQFVRFQYVNLGSDFTWTFADRASLMISELAVGLFCTCVPLLHPLAERIFPEWFCTFAYENSDENHTKPPPSGDVEKSHRKRPHHHNVASGTKGASSSSIGSGVARDGGSRQKNRNHAPRERLEDPNPPLRRDDSGDMSDDIMGLQSALKGLKRLSFNRSQSEADVRRSPQHRNSKELAGRSSRLGVDRTHTSPYMQSPTLGWELSSSPVEKQPEIPTVVVRPPQSPVQTSKGRGTPVVPSTRQSLGDGNEAGPARNYSPEQQQQQQDQPQQLQSRRYLHQGTFYNSVSEASSYYNKKLPAAPKNRARGLDVYMESSQAKARFE